MPTLFGSTLVSVSGFAQQIGLVAPKRLPYPPASYPHLESAGASHGPPPTGWFKTTVDVGADRLLQDCDFGQTQADRVNGPARSEPK